MSDEQQPPRRRRRRSRRRPGGRPGGRPDGAPQGASGEQAAVAPSGGYSQGTDPGPRPHGPAQGQGHGQGHGPGGPAHGHGPRPHGHGSRPQHGQGRPEGERRPQAQGRSRQRGHGRPHRGKRPWQRRGRGSEHWWTRRWVEVLESFEVGRRLGRGRLYARQGQVLELEIGEGFVTAQVQGSRDAPYLVRMRFSMLSSTDWKKVTKEIAADPMLSATLASGQMPEGVEAVFDRLELSLFPRANGDLKTACSCPDPANPCKHVAAVYYLLGEEIDRDPYVLFRLRGLEKSELIAALGGPVRGTPMPPPPPPRAPEPTREREPVEESADEANAELARDDEGDFEQDADDADLGQAPAWAEDPLEPDPPPVALPAEPHAFWAGGDFSAKEVREARIPVVPAALTKRLGALPFQRGEDPTALLERIYRNASLGGLEVFLGERTDESEG